VRIIQLSSMESFYGGEAHLDSLARGLRDRGHDVCCVVRPHSQLQGVLAKHGMEIRTLPLGDWYDPWSVKGLSDLVKDWGCEILHTHLPRDYYLAAAATTGSQVVNVGTRHLLHPISVALLKRPFLGRFSSFIAVSEAVRNGILKSGVLGPEILSVIYNGIETEVLPVLDETKVQDLRALCGSDPEDLVVGFVGRLCPSKGTDTLIKAMSKLQERGPKVCLCLIGEETSGSGYRDQLVEMVNRLGLADRVGFAGYIAGASQFSTAFDIQVVPSVAEPFGLVTLEAMRAGVPVVVTNTGGSPEVMRDGVEGFLFEPGDEVGLAHGLDRLLESPERRLEMGRRGRQRVLESFSRSGMIRQTEEVYWRALQKAKPAAG